jgi:shikimate kinase
VTGLLETGQSSRGPARRAGAMSLACARPLVIELVGPAGTGKTTLLRALAARDTSIRAGVRVDRLRDLPLVLRYSVRLAPVVLGGLGRSVRLAGAAAMHLVRLDTLLAIVSRADPGTAHAVVLDEGPTFILTRLAAFHDRRAGGAFFDSAWERGLRRTASVLDAIVWLDAPNAVLARRIRDRAKPHRFKSASDSELWHFLDHYRDTYSRIVDRVAATGATRVLRLDTSRQSADRLVREIAGVIERRHA